MPWPLSQDYNEAIQDPLHNFSDADLKTGEAVANALGIPMPRSGNFADVYEVRCPSGSRWAVKCFTREVPGLRERYAAISRHLQQAKLPFTVDFTFLDQGIRVLGRWFPVLKMQWVEGLTLNEFVRQNADKPAKLESLLHIWVRMASRLREVEIAHGDLQHGNILLVPYGAANALALKLVDYDGMFVPSLARGSSGEFGHPCYQHPQRLAERLYSLDIDRFPLLLIATTLACLQVGGRALWDKYDSGDNLLFREAGLYAPAKSPLFYQLLKLEDRQALRLVWETLDALKGRLEAVPPLENVLPEMHSLVVAKSKATLAKLKRSTVVTSAAQTAEPSQPHAEAIARSTLDFKGRGGLLSRKGIAAVATVTALVLALGVFLLVFWVKEKTASQDTSRSEVPEHVQRAINEGVAALRKLQTTEGIWPPSGIGPTALAGLTLLECGAANDDPAVLRAARAVRKASLPLTHTYSLALSLLFLDRLGDADDVPLIESLCVRLRAGQTTSGGWSDKCPDPSQHEIHRLEKILAGRQERVEGTEKPKRDAAKRTVKDLPKAIQDQLAKLDRENRPMDRLSDNSNTQFATLALWIGRRYGLPVEGALDRMEKCFRTNQNADGGWGSRDKAKVSTPSMTCAGLFCLAVAKGMRIETARKSDATGAASPKIGEDLELEKGLSALSKMMERPTDPDFSPFCLWTLERVAVALGRKTLGQHDWYEWSSYIVLAKRQDDGSWPGVPSYGPNTCFAVLVLQRANLTSDLATLLKPLGRK